MNTKKFVHLDSHGNSWGVVSTEQMWANVYAMKYNKPENKLDQNIWKSLFAQAKAAAVEFGADSIEVRIRLEYEPEIFRKILTDLGLKQKAGRIEYQKDVIDLPGEEGTPFNLKTVTELGWDLEELKNFMEEIVQGALDIDSNEKIEDFIQDWLHHNELTNGPECIAIGLDRGRPCALTVAQINRNSGWSRISYLGLIPSHRGQNLGKWVHRHGFTMLKAQGGKLYHGGTHIENQAMRRLFESHGCRVYCEMEEWSCLVTGRPA
jgi:hypothetical protein